MMLRDLLTSEARCDGRFATLAVTGISADSRAVKPGFLFVAVPGTKVDGLGFLSQAVAGGAVAVLAECEPPAPLPAHVALVSVPNVRRALALAAARFYPRQPATIAAVTGTGGKTSVTAFTRQIWTALGHAAASIGTVGVVTPAGEEYGALTTPDPVELHRIVDRIAGEGITHLAVEASSHGLDQHRLDGLRVGIAGFTNISRDHLDYHGTQEAYRQAKLILFRNLVKPDGVAVVAVDHTFAAEVKDAARGRSLRIIEVGRTARDIRLISSAVAGFSQVLTLGYGGVKYQVQLPLVGAFQVENALVAAGQAEVRRYAAEIVTARVEAVTAGDGFELRLDDGRTVAAQRLLVTTGLIDELPEIPGLAQRFGRDVLHCPYCHGFEVADRRIGVLATGPAAQHQAELWRQWSPHVLLLLHGAWVPTAEQAERLAARGIVVVDGPVADLEITEDALTGARLATGEVVALDAMVVAPRFTARADLLESIGLKPVDIEMAGQVIGSQVPAEATGATAVPGVWVAGNVADVRAQVITAAAAGLAAGSAINADLIAEETRDAVETYRENVRTMFERPAWEARYQSQSSIWSGRPNPQLVAEAAELAPGRALDIGSGEGADAVWLADRGWQVDAVDISTTALARAATHAESLGVEGITWTHLDVRAQPPAERTYDLVSSQFMHLPADARRQLFARLAAAVAPGGTLLIVGHHPSDLRTTAHRMHFPEMMFTAEEVAGALDPGSWQVVTAEARPRTTADHDGREITIHDAVVVARRYP